MASINGKKITPERTYALIVGIDQYALGSGASLDGPAQHGRRFADWLCSRGVPSQNIILLLSPLDSNSNLIEQWSGPEKGSATRKQVGDAINLTLRQCRGDLLYIFWAGHGIMTPDRKRRLFYADTTAADWNNLLLDSLLTHLGSHLLSGFLRQIILVDTCANYEKRVPRTLPGDEFLSGEPLPYREQFVLFSTKAWQRAKNLTQEQTGLFFKYLLEELKGEPQSSWPPEMDLLAGRLKTRFDALEQRGIAKQTPISIWSRTWDGTEHPLLQIDRLRSVLDIPYQRNAYFTGREDTLLSLHEALIANRTVALAQPQAISGLGGIGKTQTAVEYGYRYQDEYKAVLCVRAGSLQRFISDIVRIAHLLDLPEKNEQEQQRTVDAVKRWLQMTADWLLILDNVDDFTLVHDLLPLAERGHIIITTRSQATRPYAQLLELNKLEEEEGALFLLHRSGTFPLDALLDRASANDRASTQAISRVVVGFPLALDQAGAYIEETGCSISEYLDIYLTHRKELLQRRGTHPFDHPESVVTTFTLSFERIKERMPAAIELLSLCVFLDPDAIPEEIMTKGAPDLGALLAPVTADPFKLKELMEVLRQYSLIRRNPISKTIAIHRLIQDVLKDGMDEETRRLWSERAVLAVNRTFPEVEIETWNDCQRCLPHALLCEQLMQQEKMAFSETAELLCKTGWYLEERGGQYVEAERLLTRALAIYQQTRGPEHPQTAACLHHLGVLYQKQGKHAQAEQFCQQALAIVEKVLDPGHRDIVCYLNDLAWLYNAQEKQDKAEQLLLRVLAIYEQNKETKHYYRVASSMNNLGYLYYTQGKYDLAEPHYLQALAISEPFSELMQETLASIVNNLGVLYLVQGKYAQAEPFMDRALAIREQILGPNHPEVCQSLSNLGGLYNFLARYTRAEQILKRALVIAESTLGRDHPQVARILNNLALTYKSQGKYSQVESLFQRVIVIAEQTFGPDGIDVATGLHNLAGFYHLQQKYTEAEALFDRSLVIRKHVFGPKHDIVALTMNSIAMLYRDQERYVEAELLFKEVLTIREKSLSPGHPNKAASFEGLAVLYIRQSKYAEAEPLLKQALEIRQNALGPEHPDVATCLENYATLLRKTKREVVATSFETRAKAIRDKLDQKNTNSLEEQK